eukprot:359677-Chlamydomonas_euryale.AAC.2
MARKSGRLAASAAWLARARGHVIGQRPVAHASPLPPPASQASTRVPPPRTSQRARPCFLASPTSSLPLYLLSCSLPSAHPALGSLP